jgi:hypothetical protein
VERGGAEANAMGGGEQGVRGRPSSARAKCGWWQGVPVAVKGGGVPLQCDRERDLAGHGEAAVVRAVLNATASPTREERGPRSSLALGIDARACWGARWHGGIGSAWLRARTRTRARTARRSTADASGTARRSTAARRG